MYSNIQYIYSIIHIQILGSRKFIQQARICCVVLQLFPTRRKMKCDVPMNKCILILSNFTRNLNAYTCCMLCHTTFSRFSIVNGWTKKRSHNVHNEALHFLKIALLIIPIMQFTYESCMHFEDFYLSAKQLLIGKACTYQGLF